MGMQRQVNGPLTFGLMALAAALAVACGDDSPTSGSAGELASDPNAVCDIDRSLLQDGGVPPDGIPALRTPKLVGADDPATGYLDDGDRVLGLFVDGRARAYPHKILWWHEIVNDTVAGRDLAVTFCPLTGSGLVFDKGSYGESGLDLGVSGLLFANNLFMYDRNTGRLVGPQLAVEGRCGDFGGVRPDLVPVSEMTWGRWKELHPDTRVVDDDTGHSRDYQRYPYGSYDELSNNELLAPMAVDDSRPLKELVLGVREGRAGKGYPFGELAELGDVGVVNDEVGGRPVAVFFEAGADPTAGSAVAFDPTVDGQVLTFERVESGFQDAQTGSVWDLAGRALSGPHSGRTLSGFDDAYVAFWFAWRHFQPESGTFDAGS